MERIYMVSENHNPVEVLQFTKLEDSIKGALPKGYQEFIGKYGAGELNSYLYLIAPDNMQEATLEWKETLESDFWEDSILPLDLRKEVYVLGYTIDSDLFVFHPQKNGIFCLPRQADRIYLAGETLSEAVTWIFQGQILMDACTGLYYRPREKMGLLRYDHSNCPDLNEFRELLCACHQPDHIIEEDAFIHMFYKMWGAHVSYSDQYNQLIITYSTTAAKGSCGAMKELLSRNGFRLIQEENLES